LTPEDKQLDPARLFQSKPLKLYRLAKENYANLSGIGAAKNGGRWNRIGQEAVYTSTEISAPWLERLVHTPKDLIPTNLVLMEIHLDLGDGSSQPPGHLSVFPSLRVARQQLFGTTDPNSPWSPLAVALPSVVVPVWNVVLYPRARQFWDRIKLVSVEPVEFDPRLFPVHAIPEPT
jgi:RES domain-containing protein